MHQHSGVGRKGESQREIPALTSDLKGLLGRDHKDLGSRIGGGNRPIFDALLLIELSIELNAEERKVIAHSLPNQRSILPDPCCKDEKVEPL